MQRQVPVIEEVPHVLASLGDDFKRMLSCSELSARQWTHGGLSRHSKIHCRMENAHVVAIESIVSEIDIRFLNV